MFDFKGFRRENNLTQIEVATYLGTSKSFISQIEAGTRPLPAPMLSKLLDNKEGWSTAKLSDDCNHTPVVGAQPADRIGIPLLPVEAVAGVLSGNDMQVMGYDCEYYNIPTFKGAEFLIRVSGDSMQPKYYSGDIVACKRLPIDTFFQWNRVYVIGSEQGVILKRVRQGSDAEHITLVSENTDYAPFELPLNKVHSIALVVGVVRAE